MAGDPNAIRPGQAVVEIGGDDSELNEVLRRVFGSVEQTAAKIKQVGKAVMGAGLIVTGGLVAAGLAFASIGGGLVDMSERTGIAIEALGELRFAAQQSGVSAEELEAAIGKMSDFLGSAMTPEKLATLDALGLKLDDLGRMSQHERFLAFAEALSKIEDPAQRIALAMDVMGKAGKKALGMMGEGAAGIRAMQEQFRPFRLTAEEARAGDELGDKLDFLKDIIKNTFAIIGAAVKPVLMDFIGLIADVISPVINFVRVNQELFQWALKVGAGIVVAGAALIGFSYILSGLSMLLGLTSGSFGLLTAVSWAWSAAAVAASLLASGALIPYKVGLLLVSLATTIANGATWGYTFALIAAWIWEQAVTFGIGLLITALGALVIVLGLVVLAFAGFFIAVAVIAYWPAIVMATTEAFRDLIATITNSAWFNIVSDRLSAIGDAITTAFDTIKDAFGVGDWETIFEVLKVMALIAWEHISTGAIQVFNVMHDALIDAIADVWKEMKAGWAIAWGEMKALAFLAMADIAAKTPGGEERARGLRLDAAAARATGAAQADEIREFGMAFTGTGMAAEQIAEARNRAEREARELEESRDSRDDDLLTASAILLGDLNTQLQQLRDNALVAAGEAYERELMAAADRTTGAPGSLGASLAMEMGRGSTVSSFIGEQLKMGGSSGTVQEQIRDGIQEAVIVLQNMISAQEETTEATERIPDGFRLAH